MKRSAWFLGAAAFAVTALAGCNGNEPTPEDTVTAQEAAMAVRGETTALLTGYSNAPALMALPARAANVAALHEYDLTCPLVDLTAGPLSYVEVMLDYGEGCTSQLDGADHSGQIRIRKPQNQASFTFLFTDYTTGDFTVSGGIDGTFGQEGVGIQITDLFLSGPDGITAVDGTFTGVWNLHDTPATLTDDSWIVKGNGEVTATDHKIYLFDIEDADPLVFLAGCSWPVSGRVSVRVTISGSDHSSAATTIDFGDGTCDDLALVTAAGVTRAVHLSTGQTAD